VFIGSWQPKSRDSSWGILSSIVALAGLMGFLGAGTDYPVASPGELLASWAVTVRALSLRRAARLHERSPSPGVWRGIRKDSVGERMLEFLKKALA